MASKRRQRRKQCDGKRRYKDQGEAMAGLRWVCKNFPNQVGQLRSYRCKFCNGWHLGHGIVYTFSDRRGTTNHK